MTEIEPNSVESVVPGDEGGNEFKQCNQISFYRRQKKGNRQQYRILLNTLVLTEKGAVMELLGQNTEVQLVLQVYAIRGGALRVLVDELKPIRPRYKVPDVLTREPVYERLRLDKKEENSVTLGWGVSQYQVRIQACPLLLEVLCEGEVTVTLNQKGRLYFEVLQDPPEMRPLPSVDEEEDPTGLWREKFKHFVDIKASGPSSVGVDLRLCGFSHLYGLPEHADTFQLKDTSDGEPYRLYNLDVFGYDIHSHLGLYGSVPLVLAHDTSRTIGVFWLNASETLVDLQRMSDGLPSSDLQGFTPPPAKRRSLQPHTDLIWMSESGVIDSFILLGPAPAQVFSQYAELTGYQAMPPLFSLGYHQCRWNYENEADVKEVDAGFDSHAIPYDVMWLDIEHTDEKRYFTWDPRRFPNPIRLQRHLEERNRKLVVISDPHIKVDPAWSIYCEARKSGHFVRDREGGPFCGRCWPGDSCYLDFSSTTVRAWYSSLFALEKYKGSTEIMFIWNDMNEPSVFDGPEKTMPKDAVHYGGVEHRELHNLYGFYQHLATVEGLISRSHGLERPFVLSRSFFAGSQRLGAIWTGDNVATWEHLKISLPMLLSLSVAGIAFCGADVGGFFRDPEPELLVRWYQAGSLQPFFRGHSCREMKRREPWLFGDPFTAAIRTAVQQRYCLLPYWYTLFYEAHTSAQPPMRPLWVEFPGEQDTFSVENQYMIGSALLACPVTDPGVTEVKVVLPGFSEYWYDVQTNLFFAGGKTLSLPVTLDTVPLFQRGGTILPRKTEAGSCSADLQKYPFTLTVALDSKACAVGRLFLDDGHSFSYQDRKEFSLRRFSLQGGRLVCCSADDAGLFEPGCTVSSVSFLGVKNRPSAVTTHISGVEEICKSVQYQEDKHLLLVGDLNLNVGKDWEIRIQ